MEQCSNCELMLSELHAKYASLKELFSGLSNCLPDMMWAKDLSGAYKYANSKLAYGMYKTTVVEMLGKTDEELSKECLSNKCSGGFTFGLTCTDSDKKVLSTQEPMRIVERGLVDGKEIVLMVHKSVEKDIHGNVIGTVGTARDVTSEFFELKRIQEETSDANTAYDISEMINKYYYNHDVDINTDKEHE